MPSFGRMDLRLYNNCNVSNKNFTEVGDSYALPDGIERNSDESISFIAGIENFTVDELEVYKVELSNIETPFEELKVNNDNS